jgi:oxygen-independent coproporphyrinogen-3 oxidase
MSERIAITVAGQRASTSGPLREGRAGARSLYIHVPFCFHKCHYCDFYSFVDTQDRQGPFLDRLELELRALAPHAGDPSTSNGARLDTLFVGGGTPSLLRPDLWSRLLTLLDELFAIAPAGRAGDIEFTVECNPETVTPELMAIFAAGGVNRVSIGAQSFSDAHLKTLERWHNPDNVNRALQLAADAGIRRRSIDLIFGVPGQTLDDWAADLDRALALPGGVEHLSCYALTYEPNTAMTARLKRGEFTPLDEDLEVAMQRHTVARLRAAGFHRYEVSNFAQGSPSPARSREVARGSDTMSPSHAIPATACAHNLVYWRQGQWLAAGPSASAHVRGHRWKNLPRLTDWMDGVQASGGYSPMVDHEPPDDRRLLAETLMTGLRLSEGVDARALLARAERFACAARLQHRAEFQRDRGLLTITDQRWTLTDDGFLFADGIAADLMAAIPR